MSLSTTEPPAAASGPRGVRKDKTYAKTHIGFAWLRMFGAILVIIEHSWALIDPENPSLFPANWHVGEIGILAFFAMSGYQVQQSWEGDPSWWRFAGRRIVRIVPPLAVVLFCTALIIGPIFTTLSLGDYFSNGITWEYLLGAFPIIIHHLLPGVFETNPSPYSINPSVWTLPMEIIGYTSIIVLGALVALGVSRLILPLFAIGLAVQQGIYMSTIGEYGAGGYLFETPLNFLVKFGVAFVLGMTMYRFKDKIPQIPVVALGLLALWLAINFGLTPVATEATPGWEGPGETAVEMVLLNQYVMVLLAVYGSVTWANHWPKRMERPGNWVLGSYGMYIWAGIIQSTYIAIGVQNRWGLLAISLPTAYLLGLLSWHYVELPTQKLRRFFRGKDLTVPSAKEAEQAVVGAPPADPAPASPPPAAPAPAGPEAPPAPGGRSREA